MSVFRCKMCGGNLNVADGQTVCECEYCGTKQTVPALDNEKKAQLFARANKLRFGCEFDKASGIYETIITDYPEEAEAYWGLLLCKYGIEYVDDPKTGKKIPTCHRSSFDSIFDDNNFDMIMENSDTLARGIYREEAKAIEEIRKGIIEVSSKEEPYDIFICYKETDENGNRTLDSVIAQDVYNALTEKKYKVFFSRITLEEKLGVEYEPYIFAALNSAKIMLVFGTNYENFNAVWVKNEWSRYLQLIEAGQKKYLIPCFKNIDAYDIPKEFAKLQAQDMGKVGAIQDLLRGIDKIITSGKEKETVREAEAVNNTNVNSDISSLLGRGYLALEDGDWSTADRFFEDALNRNFQSSEAYLGKLMAELKVSKKDDLKNCAEPFDSNNNCIKAGRFDPALAEKFKADNEFIRERNETDRKQVIYDNAKKIMSNAKLESALVQAADKFDTIIGFKDADDLKKQCLEKAEISRKDAMYYSALKEMTYGKDNYSRLVQLKKAIKTFNSIIDWKDSRTKIDECNKKIEEIKIAAEKAEAERKQREEEARIAAEKAKAKKKKTAMIVTPIVAVVIVFLIVLEIVIIPEYRINKLVEKYGISKVSASEILNAKAGDTITFGSYEQDNDTSNGKEEIEWTVLEVKGGKALIISNKVLDCQQYNTEDDDDITWETCSLRAWLNDDFMNTAFSEGEQSIIADTEVISDDEGNDTTDKVFVLSKTEAEEYFSSDDERVCKATAYAVSNGVYKYGSGTYWWLRTCSYNGYADDIDYFGDIDYSYNLDRTNIGVRPALWIEI